MTKTLLEIRADLVQGKTSVRQVLEGYAKRAQETKPLNAFLIEPDLNALESEIANAQARMDAREARPLEGLPISVKDLFCTKGRRTTAGSNMLKTFVPPYESTVTQKMRDAGAIVWGKCAMDSFAMGSGTNSELQVANPLRRISKPDEPLIAGGSSSGPAVAVACGAAPASLGSDTGGSVRMPAALCGLVGMRPTYGRCSRWGMVGYASSLDQAGVFAHTVSDVALLMQNIMGHDPKDATSVDKPVPDLMAALLQDPKGIRVGIPIEYEALEALSPAVRSAWMDGIERLRQAGCEIKRVSVSNVEHALRCYYVIATSEASSNLARYNGIHSGTRIDAETLSDVYVKSRSAGFNDEVKRRILMGTYFLTERRQEEGYIYALRVRRLIQEGFQRAFDSVDVLLTPTTTDVAWPFNRKASVVETYEADILTVAAPLAGLGGIAVPCGVSDGLPIGLTIVGRAFEESTWIAAAKALEAPTPFLSRSDLCFFLKQNL